MAQFTSKPPVAGQICVGNDYASNTNPIPVSIQADVTSPSLSNTSRLLSAAASTNATSVKASAGSLFKIRGYNAAAAVRYLKLYNKASAPTVGTDTPVVTLHLPAASTFDIDFGKYPVSFSTGIAYALTQNIADDDTTALVAADILALNIWYS